MTEGRNGSLQTILQTGQLVMLVIGVATLFATIGKRDAVIETNSEDVRTLREIATDLVKASVETATTNREQDRRLDDLRLRLARLESQ